MGILGERLKRFEAANLKSQPFLFEVSFHLLELLHDAVVHKLRVGHIADQISQRAMGELLDRTLTERLGNHRHVGDIRGRGLFRGVELVADRATKEPFDPALRLHARIKSEAMQRGLICYPMGGTVDGRKGDHVLLAPPFIIEAEHVELIVDRLAASIDSAVGDAL